jgi:hypothetical protein
MYSAAFSGDIKRGPRNSTGRNGRLLVSLLKAHTARPTSERAERGALGGEQGWSPAPDFEHGGLLRGNEVHRLRAGEQIITALSKIFQLVRAKDTCARATEVATGDGLRRCDSGSGPQGATENNGIRHIGSGRDSETTSRGFYRLGEQQIWNAAACRTVSIQLTRMFEIVRRVQHA